MYEQYKNRAHGVISYCILLSLFLPHFVKVWERFLVFSVMLIEFQYLKPGMRIFRRIIIDRACVYPPPLLSFTTHALASPFTVMWCHQLGYIYMHTHLCESRIITIAVKVLVTSVTLEFSSCQYLEERSAVTNLLQKLVILMSTGLNRILAESTQQKEKKWIPCPFLDISRRSLVQCLQAGLRKESHKSWIIWIEPQVVC